MTSASLASCRKRKFQFAIDRGGTFTDVWARCPNGKVRVLKLLSEDPSNYEDAPKEAIRRILQQETNSTNEIDINLIEWIRMGTTVATNALLERKGERMALVTTKGFKDLLHIGNQSRPNLFDLEIVCPDNLYECVVEADERVILQQEKCQIQNDQSRMEGTTGEMVQEWKGVDLAQLQNDLQSVLDKGISSLAVVLMHSYIYPNHELSIGKLATEMGFTNVSLSSQVMSMAKIVPRGYTACADAYLTPCIKKYLEGFSDGLKDTKILFMRSDGGLTPMEKFMGCHAILSGPAGGVVGYAQTTFDADKKVPVIGFDMGGTSTDVSRYSGQFEHVFETTTSGITIQAPQLDINTVAAGGGSMLFFRAGMFVVGPDSARAHPGPTCYMKGGPLTITDANLCLGRLLPEYFPHIFGKNEDQPLDKVATLHEFDSLRTEINNFLEHQSEDSSLFKPMSREEIALGFIRVANETMCRPIRALTQAKGYDTSRHILACFGGAGGQHACAIARSLGMNTVFIHKYAGILSAFGMALADVVYEAQEPSALLYSPENYPRLDERIQALEKQCRQDLQSQGFNGSNIELQPFLNLRYEGTDCALMCTATLDTSSTNGSGRHNSSVYGDFYATFLKRYQTEFGFTLKSRKVCVDDIRVRGVGKSKASSQNEIAVAQGEPVAEKTISCWFEEGCLNTQVFVLNKLQAGHRLPGPAIIIDANNTVLVEPNCCAEISLYGDISITVGSANKKVIGTDLDAIQLSIFSHRFMSIAEQMGRVLQWTAISTNIKERLDFSCAMFGPDGGLVANAPHIPVHLGAMQETVQYQMRQLIDNIHEGDVILTNHPEAGGSHLPDLTVITPVFHKSSSKPVFYVASRGHHADIGGISPGSMPAHSTSIFQEGAVFKSFKLVEAGEFKEKELIQALNDPAKYPGSSGTRNLHDNLSDLRAQVAANQKGIRLILELIEEYGLDLVQAYMKYIQDNAELAVKDMLRGIAKRTKERTGKTELYGEDFMDGGFKICLNINIDETQGTAIFDFTGTCHQVHGNINAPRAITKSAIIYCLRCMVGHDVPLNQGCLTPIHVVLPKGSLLDPSETAAVVGGNVLTSQRVVDVIFKAFNICAASQGCMNIVTFGDETMGYCETVAGGAGAGPTWHGRSGVHTHMTNTRITDPEIIEKRYPVILKSFHLNPGSGGLGLFNGGDGIVRELLFRRTLTLSVLSERRVFSPYGLGGGHAGKLGENLMLYSDGRICNLGAKTAVQVGPGDVFRLQTPGGGGYGCPKSNGTKDDLHCEDNERDGRKREMATQKPRVEEPVTRHGGSSLFTYQKRQESA